jgi:hypothetical protein
MSKKTKLEIHHENQDSTYEFSRIAIMGDR